MQAGYHRVSVVRGGFPALLDANVSVAPKPVAPAAAGAAPSAVEA